MILPSHCLRLCPTAVSLFVPVNAATVSDESRGVSESGLYFSEGVFTGLISSPSRKAVSVKRAKCLEGSCASLIVAPGTGSPCVAAVAGLLIRLNSC